MKKKKDYGITKLYRAAHKMYIHHIPLIPKIIQLAIRLLCSATIPYKCEIGYGTKFPHGAQGVVLNSDTRIGENCIVSAGTIIGGKKGSSIVPIIGNNVILGANSTLIGPISVGDNAIIGAGSVVVKNVDCNTVVCGNPAKVINSK